MILGDLNGRVRDKKISLPHIRSYAGNKNPVQEN
jgi:hypothetical protein